MRAFGVGVVVAQRWRARAYASVVAVNKCKVWLVGEIGGLEAAVRQLFLT